MSETRPPKKSESLEIRLPYATKQALMARCRAEQRTASAVVREMIDRRLQSPRARIRRPLRWVAGVLALAAAGAAAAPTLARTSLETAFERLDQNGDGRLDRREFAKGVAVEVRIAPARAGAAAPEDRWRLEPAGGDEGLSVLVLNRAFERLDADRDGLLTIDEYRRRSGIAASASS